RSLTLIAGSGEWGVGSGEWEFSVSIPLVCLYVSLGIISPLGIVSLPTPHSPLPSSPPLPLRPLVALNKNLAVGRHTRFGETEAGFQLQLDSDDLFHALVAEVGVLRREGGYGVDA